MAAHPDRTLQRFTRHAEMTMDRVKARELSVITDTTDSNEILARARSQAAERGLDNYFIVDIDSHIGDGEAWPEVLKFVENETVRDAARFFGNGTGRGAFLNDTPGLQYQHVG